MKKDKKFLKELEANLVGIKDKYKSEILLKYEELIKEEKSKNKKITSILKEIGKPEEVAKKELELLGGKGSLTIFDNLKNKYNDYKNKKRENRENKEFKKESKKLKKNGVKVSIKGIKNEKINNKKETKKEEKPKKEKVSLKERLSKFKEFLTKERTLKKKDKVKKEKVKKEKEVKEKKEKHFLFFGKKKEREVKQTPSEIVEEVKEEIKEEISEAAEVVSETHIFESKEKRRKRILVKTLGIILTTLLLFVWMWVSILLVASVVAYLDGVKFKGFILALFGLDLLVLWIVVMVNRTIFRHKMSVTFNLIVCFTSIAMIAVGVVFGLRTIYKIKNVKDVSAKYTMTTKLNNYELPDDKEKKFVLTFNSNYNTQYTVNYDEMIKDRVKVEVKYYECYYDFYAKKITNGAYISLGEDKRDRLSVYIDDLKEGLIFDNDELARYTVKISINKKDADRLMIQD